MGYDRKYGKVTTEFGTIGEDEPVVVFRAQDATLPDVLRMAATLSKCIGSPERHIKILENTIKTIETWQASNPLKVKVPTSESSKERLEN
jgi:hypothetical protein